MKYIASALLIFISSCATAQEHKTETIVMPSVTFVAEQTGDFEDRLKENLTKSLLTHKEVKRAYLIATQYSDGTSGVALALACDSDKEPSDSLLIEIQNRFRELASSSIYLDTLVLKAGQEAQAKAVAKPFYVGP